MRNSVEYATMLAERFYRRYYSTIKVVHTCLCGEEFVDTTDRSACNDCVTEYERDALYTHKDCTFYYI